MYIRPGICIRENVAGVWYTASPPTGQFVSMTSDGKMGVQPYISGLLPVSVLCVTHSLMVAYGTALKTF